MQEFLYNQVVDWIPEKSRVLDLGTGDGAFLERLVREKNAMAEGVEIDPEMVARCIERGVVVHQGDILDGLDQYEGEVFDFVLLLGTFQELAFPRNILEEAFRVGKKLIIAYTNFAHWRIRFQLMFRGGSPVTSAMPHAWYNTPTSSFFSVQDFRSFVRMLELRELKSAYFNSMGPVGSMPNLRAESALTMLSQK